MNPRVLIVDDDKAIANLTAIQLRAAGYDAVTAFDGASILARARAESFDVIVLDIRMPNLDGFEVHAQLQQDEHLACIPVVFLSANVQESARRNAADVGAVFIPKPYDVEQLIQAIEQVMTKEVGLLKHAGVP